MAGQREVVKQILEFAAMQKGYKAYVVDNDEYYYGYIITPRDNVLCVTPAEFWGAFISLKYVPSKNTGSGCSCHGNVVFGEHYVMEIKDIETLVSLENEGLKYAVELKAKMYKNSRECLEKLWDKEELEEV